MSKYLIFTTLVFLILSGCEKEKKNLFRKVPHGITNITFKNKLTSRPDLNILNYLYYYNGSGTITADFNNDGLIDIYLSGNQIDGALFINKGELRFKKIELPSVNSKTGNWTTGVTQVDINNDGLLDIYICKASGYRALKGKNLLFVNQGLDQNNNPIFEEKAKKYGIDFSGLSTKAAFLDFDKDGDLDMFLLNHSVHPNINYGRGSQRNSYDSISGDRLFINDMGVFKDATKNKGIFQGRSGYGLGLSISDLNNDNYPDIYIGNDFFENDYLYINQKNGSFKDIISSDNSIVGHTTHFSMGNSIADINNDSYADIISLDMLPEDLITYKTSGLEYGYPIYQQYLKNGFAPQYMQNTLHLNNQGNNFSEIGNISGISATEWSWGSLLADFNNDGYKDLYITNGIKGATNDMDYMNFIANDDIQKRIDAGMQNTDMPLINEIPKKKTSNYFFKNNGDLTFSNVTENWFGIEPSYSNGCSYADLDNDGDLDIVVNNIDEEVFILENTTKNSNYIQIKLNGSPNNRNGIGSKVLIYSSLGLQSQEQYPGNGYLSSNSNILHFGLSNDSVIDSLKIIWPDNSIQKINRVKINQRIQLHHSNATLLPDDNKVINTIVSYDSIVDFIHKEQNTLDFNKEPLIPFAGSNEGPTIAVADINNDGLEDFFIGGAKLQPSQLYVQGPNNTFTTQQEELFSLDALSEDVTSIFADVNGDNFVDLLVASGGNEFKKGSALKPRLYINQNGIYHKDELVFNNVELNASKIDAFDFDNDNDLDILITSDQVTSQYGETPQQYFFLNDGNGNFVDAIDKIAPDLKNLGNIKSLAWQDINGDHLYDLVVVGHWMPISVFLNNGKTLTLQENISLQETNGWWNSVLFFDVDNDGDQDMVCGNWGANTKFKASKEKPITLYNFDFDGNGQTDPIVTYYHKQIETPFASKDELVKQLPILNKKFLSYSDFASASVTDLFGKNSLELASSKKVNELKTCLFINDGKGNFTKQALPLLAQTSVVNDILAHDFNNDGYKDLLIVGNNFEISTQLGRLDALHGLILYNSKNNKSYFDNHHLMLQIDGASREVDKIKINGVNTYIVGRNNDSPAFFTYKN